MLSITTRPLNIARRIHYNKISNIKWISSSNIRQEAYKNPNIQTSKKGSLFNSLLTVSGVSLLAALGYYGYNLSFEDDLEELEELENKKKRKERVYKRIENVEPLSKDKAEFLLNENQVQYDIKQGSNGLFNQIKVFGNQLASNSPIEDRYFISQSADKDQLIFGVFDGHAGFNCSEFIHKELPKIYAQEVNPHIQGLEIIKDKKVFVNKVVAIQQLIKDTFNKIDEALMNRAKNKIVKAEDLLPATNGSCAILTSVDIKHGHLFVANAGDCRAVLGRLSEDGTWKAIPLSEDHTADNPNELNRMLKQHPGEEDYVLKNKRILGMLQPTRAFGDAKFKWDLETFNKVYPSIFPNTRLPKNYKTPPYATAEPDVIYHQLEPRKDKFIVLATDGLYDELTNQQIIELVGDHLASPPKDGEYRKNKSGIYKFKDQNLATHLIRNALGDTPANSEGENIGSPLLKLLAIQAPRSRRLRDDISVLVVCFDEKSN